MQAAVVGLMVLALGIGVDRTGALRWTPSVDAPATAVSGQASHRDVADDMLRGYLLARNRPDRVATSKLLHIPEEVAF